MPDNGEVLHTVPLSGAGVVGGRLELVRSGDILVEGVKYN